MNLPFKFEHYLKEGVAKRQSAGISRAEFLIDEAKKSFIGLKNRIDKMGIDEFSANSVVKDIHDIIMQQIRAKMLIDGYGASGNNAHEAEVSYMGRLGFSDYEISFMNDLRQSRNGINYYGKIYREDYANACYAFLAGVAPKLNKLFAGLR